MNAYKGVTPTTVEFIDSLSNQDYTELTTASRYNNWKRCGRQ